VEIVVALDGGGELTVIAPAGPVPGIGEPCRVSLPPESVTVWPTDA
jgi:hypothetical protein